MSKYRVFEISKNGKRIVQNGLTLEKAEALSQEVAKATPENAYGYEPDVKAITKLDVEKVKEIFAMSSEERQEKIKEFMTEEDLKELDKIGKGVVVGESYNFLFEGKNKDYDEEYKDYIDNIERKVLANVGVIDVKDFEWLIEQAKKVERLESILLKTKQKATEQIVKLEKENELLKVQLKKARTSRYNLGEGM
jgi:hypothetical protein